ncbi:MAG: cell wall-binding repeat-containing protein [Actinobacteria bacterium]|nr:cell wall-binding repeat-containing protein [Actinomycetota bacterium]
MQSRLLCLLTRSASKAALLAAVLVALIALPQLVAGTPALAAEGPTYRAITGTDRYATAIMVSKKAYPLGAPVVCVVKGDDFPDALAAAPLAFAQGGPVILTPSSGLTEAVRIELGRLGATTVYFIGLPERIKKQVQDALPGATIRRFVGTDRYHTATLLAGELETVVGSLDHVVLAPGDKFPDALSVAPLAASKGWAILLTPQSGPLPEVTASMIQSLGATKALVVGTYASPPASVGEFTRKVGTDRYHTSALVAEYAGSQGLSFGHVALATGENYPDALVVGPYLAQDGGILLLTQPATLPNAIAKTLTTRKADITRIDLVGLPAALEGVVRGLFAPASLTWSAIQGGSRHTLALRGDGSMWAWGNNGSGRLGDGTTTSRKTPRRIGFDTDWKALGAGEAHSLAIKTDGSLWAWGSNGSGRLGDGTTTTRKTPTRIGAATDWVAVSAGKEHSLGLKTDGSLWAWGANWYGQFGNGSAAGSLVPVRVGSLNDWVLVDAGAERSLGVRADGSLWAWGRNYMGVLGDGTSFDQLLPSRVGFTIGWSAAAAGAHHTLGLRSDGSVYGWGLNWYGEVGDGTGGAESERLTPVRVGSATNWVMVAAGSGHSVGLRSDGSIWGWGINWYGQLGNGSNVDRSSPVQMGAGKDWVAVSAGESHTLGLKRDGTLWAWGRNFEGQLGDGTNTHRWTPVKIEASPTG